MPPQVTLAGSAVSVHGRREHPPQRLFADPFHEDVGTWVLGYGPNGGGDGGEVAAVAQAVGDRGDDAFYAAWVASGDRMVAAARRRDAAGHRKSAGVAYLRASAHYASAYRPLYGSPVDQRLLDAYRRQIAAFEAGLARADEPVTRREFGFGAATLPYYIVPAEGRGNQRRPTVILIDGCDASVTDVYFATAVAASRRGYHSVVFDGPGQGGVLYEQGVPLRPDWETVVSAVIEEVVASPIVDPARIVVHGRGLGGHLAARAATGDATIAACIADPGQWDLGASGGRWLSRFGATVAQIRGPEPVSAGTLAAAQSAIEANRALRFSVLQRDFWAYGVTDLRALLDRTREFSWRDRSDRLTCPVLFTRAENDPFASEVADMAAAVHRATVMDVPAADGTAGHPSMRDRSLVNDRVLDWLDETLGAS